MGHKSTIDLTKQEAEDIVLGYLDNIVIVSNEQLSSVIEELKGGYEHGHNYRIVPDDYFTIDSGSNQ